MHFYIMDEGALKCVNIKVPLKQLTLEDIANIFIDLKDISSAALAEFADKFWKAITHTVDEVITNKLTPSTYSDF
mgnify:CR=1 FL=1